MIAISLRFTAGRFHATPWGRHVNEAVPEWPPSPWRLLRALVATWKRKLDGDPACPSEIVERLLRKLSSPPDFSLPPATIGHTRHYMPLFKKGPGDRTLVFDGFVAVDKESEIVALWPGLMLEEPEQTALQNICGCLGFLGRAESWTEARVLSAKEADVVMQRINCMPDRVDSNKDQFETARVLCVDQNSAFGNEHTPKIVSTKGKGQSKQQISSPVYDPDWHLCMETLELHEKHWSDPPGACWITYLRRKDCFAVSPHRQAPLKERLRPNVVRFAIDRAVLPLVQDTLQIAEIARRTAMGIYRRIEEYRLYDGNSPQDILLPRSDVFSGKNATGGPLDGHRHAFYLPTDEDEDGRLDHLTIVAEMGFGPSEVKALDHMRWLKRDDGEPLGLVLLGLGQTEAIFAPHVLGPSRVWISVTPFIATRHPKSRGRKKDPEALLGPDNQRLFARQVLLEEIARLQERRPDIPEPVMIESLNAAHVMGPHNLRPSQFKRFRRKHGDDGGRRPAGAFRIEFAGPVRGPICLGHSSHFGMGLFVPEQQKKWESHV